MKTLAVTAAELDRHNPDRFDARDNRDGTFTLTPVRWWDEASYAAFQADPLSDQPADEELVDLWACARGDFGPDDEDETDETDETDVRVPLPATDTMACWKCDGVRDCDLNPCPLCGADAVPF